MLFLLSFTDYPDFSFPKRIKVMKHVLLFIVIVLSAGGCNSENRSTEETVIDTPKGQVLVEEFTIEATPQTIVVLEGDKLAALQKLEAAGADFVAHYLPEVEQPNLKDYDAAFRAWQLDQAAPFTDQQVIDSVGGFLGNKLVADFDMQWVLVTDEYGTNYAVRSTEVEAMSFPFAAVSKRIEDNSYDFVYGIYYAVQHTIDSSDVRPQANN